MKCIELEEQHRLAITELQQQLQAEHNQLLENMKMKSQEKEENLQKEVKNNKYSFRVILYSKN